MPPYDRAVNTVFQDYALFPHMTVGENVAYGLKVAKVSTRPSGPSAATRRWRWCGCPATRDRKPGELSGGQRQRVALARAIVNRPKVLLLDEPLGALDLKLREQMQVELKTIQGEVGITFVYVTHDQDEALTMSDRIAVFNEGRIEQVSPPVELYEQPAQRVRRRLRRRLQPDRARRRAADDPAREDPAAGAGRRRRRAAHRAAAGSPRSPTRGWSPATRSRSSAGGRRCSWSDRTWRARRGGRRPSRAKRLSSAGARSTRPPSGGKSTNEEGSP